MCLLYGYERAAHLRARHDVFDGAYTSIVALRSMRRSCVNASDCKASFRTHYSFLTLSELLKELVEG